jgi:hypothetical protein
MSVTLNLPFKRVPVAGWRNECKTGMDAIPDDPDVAGTRTHSNS